MQFEVVVEIGNQANGEKEGISEFQKRRESQNFRKTARELCLASEDKK